MKTRDGRKLNRKVLEHIRMNAIQMINKGKKPSEIAKAIGFCRQIIYTWLKKKKKYGIEALEMREAPGAKPYLNHNQLNQLKRALLKPATEYDFNSDLWNANKIMEYIKKFLHIEYTTRGIQRLLKREGYSFQKPIKRATEQQKKLKEWWLRVKWPKLLKKAQKEHRIIYFEDESGIRSDHVTGRTWALRGKTPIVRRPASWKNINLLSVVSPCGRMQFMTNEQKIDTKIFLQFISRILRHHIRRKILLIIDNSGPHKSKIAKEFYKKNESRLQVEFLPPYSPELNPSEYIWAIFKKRPLNRIGVANYSLQKQARQGLSAIQKDRKMIRKFFLCLSVV